MRKKKGIIIDPDLMGLAGAIFFATVVMGIGFWREVSGVEIAFRVGVTFVVAYAVIFLFVRYVLHVAVMLMIERKQEEKRALAEAKALLDAAERERAAQQAEEEEQQQQEQIVHRGRRRS